VHLERDFATPIHFMNEQDSHILNLHAFTLLLLDNGCRITLLAMNSSSVRSSSVIRHAISLFMWPFLNRVRHLQGLHTGEECYIFGDGSSIKSFSLARFADRPGIAVGVMPRHIDFPNLDVRYWMLPEPMFFWPAFRRGPYASRADRKLFQTFFRPRNMVPKSIKSFLNVTNFPTGLFHNVQYVFDRFPGDHRFRESTYSVDWFAGSINASISLAIYLGFTKAYLIGFDYTHEPATAGHWYEMGKGIPQTFEAYNVDFFLWASQYIDIVTVTRDQQSTRLNSIDYRTLTGEELTYRENLDLLSRDEMTSLAVWPDYRIF
jgi:hypothetical protein